MAQDSFWIAFAVAVTESEDSGGDDDDEEEPIGDPEDGAMVEGVSGVDVADAFLKDGQALAGSVGGGLSVA